MDRLLSDTIDVVEFIDGRKKITTKPNVTDCELKLLIHLTQICNNKGTAMYVTCMEVISALKMSIKSFYNALHGLEDKQYIKVKKHSKSNYNITINNNEFKTKKNYKRGYINTNNDIFIPGTALNACFNELGLNAKKTLLYILVNYNRKRGYRFTTNTLAKHLGVQNIRIHRYLNACKRVLGNFFKRHISISGVVVAIKPNNIGMSSNQSVYPEQWTYQKRMFYKFITHNNINVLLSGKNPMDKQLLHSYLNKLFNLLTTYGIKLGRYKTLHTIYENLLYHQSLDIGKIKIISKVLSNMAALQANNNTNA